MLKDTVPADAFSLVKDVEGKVARASILKGEILLAGRLTAEGEGSTLAAVVARDMRAVSVRVDDVVGVAGFLLPGNYVDVVSAYREGAERSPTRSCRTSRCSPSIRRPQARRTSR